jgi:hypothetical protein
MEYKHVRGIYKHRKKAWLAAAGDAKNAQAYAEYAAVELERAQKRAAKE